MSEARVSEQAPIPMLLFGDLLGYFITVGPSAAAFTFCVYVAIHAYSLATWAFLALVFLLPAIFFVAFVTVVFLLRLILPKLRPGRYRADFNLGMFAWIVHLGLSRSGLIFGLREFILCSNLTKFLFWRALGGRVDFRTTVSLNIALVDLPLLHIEEGCTLGDAVFICAHHFVGNEIELTPVHLGKNVFVGKDVVIMPGTDLQDRAWVGMQCVLGPDLKVETDAKIGPANILSRTTIAAGEKIPKGRFRDAD